MNKEQILFGDWLQKWLVYKGIAIKYRTLVRYKGLVEVHIAKGLGKYEIHNLTLDIVQEYIHYELKFGNTQTKQGLSISSVKTIVQIIVSAMQYAVDCGKIPTNRLLKLQTPKLEQNQIQALTLQDQRKIENYILNKGKPNHIGIIICLYTGLRLGELLALQWRDIDLQNSLLHINHTYSIGQDQNGKCVRMLTTPKSQSSKRIIPLPQFLTNILKSMHKASKSQYVLATYSGSIVHPRAYQRTFEFILRASGVKKVNFHALRHTFATRALENGMDIKSLSEIMGHSNPTITLTRYAHSFIETKRKMMNNLGKLSLYNFQN